MTARAQPWVNVAASYVSWCTEDTENRSKAIDCMLTGVHLDPAGKFPWCAAFVHHCGYYGLYDAVTKSSAWPAPATGGCAPLGAWAKAQDCLHTIPAVGDIFLIYRAGPGFNRFAHTGFVIGHKDDGAYYTIEGNTNTDGSREGIGVFERVRRPRPGDGFVSISQLLGSA